VTDLFGVDLSSVQSSTPPVAVDFAYLRVRRSNGAVDDMWGTHYTHLAGKLRAPYIFVRPPSVENFATQISSLLGLCNWNTIAWEWGPVLDCEWTGLTGYSGPPMTAAQVVSLVAETRAQLGNPTAVVYVYLGHENAGMASTIAVDGNVRFIGARYYANNRDNAWSNFGPAMPNQDVVQYWNAGTVAGVSGAVDLNDAKQLLGGNRAMTDPVENNIQAMVADIQLRVASMHAYGYLPVPGVSGAPGGDLTWLMTHVATALTDGVINAPQGLVASVSALDAKLDGVVAAINGETDKDKAALLTAIQAIPAGTLNPAVLSAVQSLLTALSTSTPTVS
jgi:hypothetical protein